MKIKYIICIGLLSFLGSCLKDKGNYTYETLPPVDIIGFEKSYRVFLQEDFTIAPQINTTINEADLSYHWLLNGDTIASTKTLQHRFLSEATKSYNLIFEVYDKKRNVRYSQSGTLSIVSPYQTGWSVLAENDANSVFSFLSYEGEGQLYKDVYRTVNGEPLEKGAFSVKQLIAYDVDRLSLLLQEGKSPELDGTTFKRVKYYNDEFRAAQSFSPIASNVNLFENDRFILFTNADGKAYANVIGAGPVDGGWYEYPLPSDNLGYKIGVGGYVKSDLMDYYVTHDDKNGRYLRFMRKSVGQALSNLILDNKKPAAFDPDNTPGTSVWSGRSNTARALSIIRRPNGKYVLHVFFNGWDESYRERWIAEASYEFPENVITSKSVFSANKINPYLYIGTGKNLYAMNLAALSPGDNPIQLLNSYEADITAVEHAYRDLNGISYNELALAIDSKLANGDEGSLLFLDPQLNKKGAIIKRVDGFGGHIVSIDRKRQQ